MSQPAFVYFFRGPPHLYADTADKIETAVIAYERIERIAQCGSVRSPGRVHQFVPSAVRSFRPPARVLALSRSEERGEGKECVSMCRSRWWPYHQKKKSIRTM